MCKATKSVHIHTILPVLLCLSVASQFQRKSLFTSVLSQAQSRHIHLISTHLWLQSALDKIIWRKIIFLQLPVCLEHCASNAAILFCLFFFYSRKFKHIKGFEPFMCLDLVLEHWQSSLFQIFLLQNCPQNCPVQKVVLYLLSFHNHLYLFFISVILNCYFVSICWGCRGGGGLREGGVVVCVCSSVCCLC